MKISKLVSRSLTDRAPTWCNILDNTIIKDLPCSPVFNDGPNLADPKFCIVGEFYDHTDHYVDKCKTCNNAGLRLYKWSKNNNQFRFHNALNSFIRHIQTCSYYRQFKQSKENKGAGVIYE